MIAQWLTAQLMQVAAEPLLLIPAIILASFILEDAATVSVAFLAGRGLIHWEQALFAAVVGTILGDLGLYAAARWASGWSLVARWQRRPMVMRALEVIRRHALFAVSIARFLPGTRLPVFVAAGAAGMSAPVFAVTIVLTTLVWTPALYFAASGAAMVSLGLNPIAGAALALILIGSVVLTPRLAMRLATVRA